MGLDMYMHDFFVTVQPRLSFNFENARCFAGGICHHERRSPRTSSERRDNCQGHSGLLQVEQLVATRDQCFSFVRLGWQNGPRSQEGDWKIRTPLCCDA